MRRSRTRRRWPNRHAAKATPIISTYSSLAISGRLSSHFTIAASGGQQLSRTPDYRQPLSFRWALGAGRASSSCRRTRWSLFTLAGHSGSIFARNHFAMPHVVSLPFQRRQYQNGRKDAEPESPLLLLVGALQSRTAQPAQCCQAWGRCSFIFARYLLSLMPGDTATAR